MVFPLQGFQQGSAYYVPRLNRALKVVSSLNLRSIKSISGELKTTNAWPSPANSICQGGTRLSLYLLKKATLPGWF